MKERNSLPTPATPRDLLGLRRSGGQHVDDRKAEKIYTLAPFRKIYTMYNFDTQGLT